MSSNPSHDHNSSSIGLFVNKFNKTVDKSRECPQFNESRGSHVVVFQTIFSKFSSNHFASRDLPHFDDLHFRYFFPDYFQRVSFICRRAITQDAGCSDCSKYSLKKYSFSLMPKFFPFSRVQLRNERGSTYAPNIREYINMGTKRDDVSRDTREPPCLRFWLSCSLGEMKYRRTSETVSNDPSARTHIYRPIHTYTHVYSQCTY